MSIIEYLIGISGITGAIVILGRYLINWIGNAGLEKYKTELNKEVLKHKNSLDKELEEFKIKNTRLHFEQVEIIKTLYSKLIKAEKPLEYLMRPVKTNPDKTKEEISKEVVKNANDFFDYYAENEIIFSETTCQKIDKIKDKYIQVWNTFDRKEFMGEAISGPMLVELVDEMHKAYKEILEGEMQVLKNELKKDFRIRLGVIERD